MSLNPYLPCVCGSGNQFKFCCQPFFPQVEQAREQLQRGQKAAALATVRQITDKFPEVPQAWGYRASLYTEADEVEEAEEAIEKAFSLSSNFAYGYWVKGMIRLREGEFQGALILFRKGVELADPKAKDLCYMFYGEVAEIELTLNRLVAARYALEQAHHINPQDESVKRAVIGIFGPESNVPPCARKAYGLRKATTGDQSLWNSALEAGSTGKLSDAIKAFENVTAGDPQSAAGWFNLGVLRAWNGEDRKAVDALNKSLELDSDAALLEEAGALIEVLRSSISFEKDTDYVTYQGIARILNFDRINEVLGQLMKEMRLLPLRRGEEQDQSSLAAYILQKLPEFSLQLETPVVGVDADLLIRQDEIFLWSQDQERLHRLIAELHERAKGGISEAQTHTQLITLGSPNPDLLVFPIKDQTDMLALQAKLSDHIRHYFEETWANRSLKSLRGKTPLEASQDPQLKKHLPGLVRFMADWAQVEGPRIANFAPDNLYDFNRLRAKLGLSSSGAASAAIDYDTIDAPTLKGLDADKLNDGELDQAFRASMRLDETDLAKKLAHIGTQRNTIADRYNYFAYLIRQAYLTNDNDHIGHLLEAAETADKETNQGGRKVTLTLARARLLQSQKDITEAENYLLGVIEAEPEEMAYRVALIEQCLRHGMPERAVEFAENALRVARQAGNRDAQQHLSELQAEARKKMG
jgi:tetratricopeptide (TPR) repeat protein